MPSREAWVERSKVLLRQRCEAQVLGIGLQYCFIQIGVCFVRAIICNRSKSLHDKIYAKVQLSGRPRAVLINQFSSPFCRLHRFRGVKNICNYKTV